MVQYKFGQTLDNMAKATGRNLSISTKKSVEICDNIRGKSLKKAKNLLEAVIEKERPIKMRRFIRDTAHRKATGPGKYPIKTAQEILKLLKSAESNAQNSGLSTNDLYVHHISADKASRVWHYGRKRRRQMKRTHMEVILIEKKVAESKVSK
jgi:large subunit ribosomal protein L22